MTPSLLRDTDRTAIVARLDRLTETATPRWGRLTAARMLAHLTDAFRMALGEVAVTPIRVPFARSFPLKHLILYVIPFPKNAPTAPEIITRAPEPFELERAQLKQLIERMRGNTGAQPHPVFGTLTPHEWGVLGYKHLDHHLKQFGL